MNRSVSNDSTSSLTSADLSRYREELARARSAQSMVLHRSKNRPSISSILHSRHDSGSDHSPLIDAMSFPFLDPAYSISVLKSRNPEKIREVIGQIGTTTENAPRVLFKLLKSLDFMTALSDLLSDSPPEPILIDLLHLLSGIFPYLTEPAFVPSANALVDNGIALSLIDFLSTPSPSLTTATLSFLNVGVQTSSYLRDSVLCMGIHLSIIDLALSCSEPQIVTQACETLSRIFSFSNKTDPATLTSCIPLLAPLLNLENLPAVCYILECFAVITTQLPVAIYILFDLSLFPTLVSFLKNDETVAAVLPLIGNICAGSSRQIKEFLNLDVFNILIGLLDGEHATQTFWALSNLLETVPYIVVQLFDEQLISKAIEDAYAAPFEVKKEAAFFLATLILFTDTVALQPFMQASLVEIFVEMLDCGLGMIVLRCLDALIRFQRGILEGFGKEVKDALLSPELMDSLESLAQQSTGLIQIKANVLHEILST